MRDYSELVKAEISWKSNEEMTEFERKYKQMIIGLLRKKQVEESSCFTLYNDILIKFGRGKLDYNDKIGKFETFLYSIAENAAKDYFREYNRLSNREVDLTDQNTATLYDISLDNQVEFEYYRVIAVETLKRLCLKYKKDLTKVEIFAKRQFAKESVQQLSDEYQKNKNEISLITSRLHEKYNRIFAEVEKEMANESMKQSSISIDFLEPIMDFPLSVA
ncbi:MAG: hypothetical protein IKB25_02835 [Lentisphaeria bacterium]|nr:hypothetical protein [Lentisphaeria bacterium]